MTVASLEWLLSKGWTLAISMTAEGRFMVMAHRGDRQLTETAPTLQSAVGQLIERLEV